MKIRIHCASATAAMLLSFSSIAVYSAPYKLTILDALDGQTSTAIGINNAGQIVGESIVGQYVYHAALWNGEGAATDLGVGQAAAINDAGHIVGYARFNGEYHAAIWNGATASILAVPNGGVSSAASSINSTGQIAGYSYIGSWGSYHHAITWSGASATDINSAPWLYSKAAAINDAGQLVGTAFISNVETHAVIWTGTTATTMTALGWHSSGANDINDKGQVVGWSTIGNGYSNQAVVWNGGIATSLGSGGWLESRANGINESGQVVGSFLTSDSNAYHAVLWSGTTAIDLNSYLDTSAANSGWVLSSAFDINDHGAIVGIAKNSLTGAQRGFLLAVSAVPEPQTYALMLAGLGLVARAARRRKQQ